MSSTVDTVAPRSFIVPQSDDADQNISGAMWISGAELYIMADVVRKVTTAV